MQRQVGFVISIMVLLGSAEAVAQDLSAGKAHYQDVCKNCHGARAQGMASFPKLAGRNAEYLEKRLKQYRAGEKVGANTAIMKPNAVNLSDKDIADIAAYIASRFE